MVNLRVVFQHAAKIAKFESALPGILRKSSSESRIIEDSSKLLRECRCIARAKGEAAFANNFHECSEIRGDYRQTSQHIFGDYQPKNFSTQGGNDNDGGFREYRIELRSPQVAHEANAPAKRRLLREALERRALRALADDDELEGTILCQQDARCFEQHAQALRGHQPALKGDNRRMRGQCGIRERRSNKFEAVRDRDASRKLQQSSKPRGRRDVAGNVLAEEPAHESQ